MHITNITTGQRVRKFTKRKRRNTVNRMAHRNDQMPRQGVLVDERYADMFQNNNNTGVYYIVELTAVENLGPQAPLSALPPPYDVEEPSEPEQEPSGSAAHFVEEVDEREHAHEYEYEHERRHRHQYQYQYQYHDHDQDRDRDHDHDVDMPDA